MKAAPDHSFAICAYGKSPFLPQCIESVLSQGNVESEVFIATSTPSDWLNSVAHEYGLRVFLNEGEHGIGQDWNYAYSCARGRYITIAHQDDVYCESYAETSVRMMDESKHPLIFFCDYGEQRGDEVVYDSPNLKVKRLLLRGLVDGKNAESISARRRALSLGCPICCPSVTLSRQNCPTIPFQTAMKCSLDWDTWEHLSRMKGAFVYSSKRLMLHRIHDESATTKLIADETRSHEDLEMFRRFWPKPVAAIINSLYSASQRSNQLT